MLGRFQPKVEVLARVPADELPWRHEGVLVLVSRGLGALRWRDVKAGGATKRALVLRNTPLLFAQSDQHWCPTCEKLLALGYGRDQVDVPIMASSSWHKATRRFCSRPSRSSTATRNE